MMAHPDCPHESDVLMMVTTGRWPERAPEDLRAHAATCAICADVATVALAIAEIDEAGAAEFEPRLPSAGTVWWRAQLRSRQDAAKEVVRPITVAQAVLLGALGVIMGAVFGATAGWFQRVIHRAWETAGTVASSIHMPALTLPDSSELAGYSTTLLLVGLVAALAMAIVVWALREDRA